MSRFIAVLCATIIGSGCSCGGGEVEFEPRDDAHVLFDFGARPESQGATPASDAIVDVAVDGTRVYLLLRQGSFALSSVNAGNEENYSVETLFYSDDGGSSWQSVKVDTGSDEHHADGLFVSGGRILMPFPGWTAGTGGSQQQDNYAYTPLGDFDLATGKATVDAAPTPTARWLYGKPWAMGDTIVSFSWFMNQSPDPAFRTRSYTWVRYSLATNLVERKDGRIDLRGACNMWDWVPLDGERFAGECTGATVLAMGEVKPLESMSPKYRVANVLEHPYLLEAAAARSSDHERAWLHKTNLGPVLLASAGGWAFASWLDGSTVRTLSLGRGEPLRAGASSALHSASGSLVVVSDPQTRTTRVLDVRPDGSLEQLAIPGSPCAEESTCGQASRLLWLQDLGNDDYLAIYWVEQVAPEEGSHQTLYSAKVHATRSPAQIPDGGPKAMAEAKVPGFESVPEAAPLEKACRRSSNCWGELITQNGLDMVGIAAADCEKAWLTTRGSVSDEPRFRAFVSRPAADCDGWAETWPEQSILATKNCKPGCVGDLAVQSCKGNRGALVPNSVTSCAALGSSCVANPYWNLCSDGTSECTGLIPALCNSRGNAVRCGNDQLTVSVTACAADAPCQVVDREAYCSPGRCTGAAATECQGDLVVTCKQGVISQAQDCSRLGMTCGQVNGQPGCVVKNPVEGCKTSCQGSVLLYCRDGEEQRWLDCGELWGVCDTDQYGSHCQIDR